MLDVGGFERALAGGSVEKQSKVYPKTGQQGVAPSAPLKRTPFVSSAQASQGEQFAAFEGYTFKAAFERDSFCRRLQLESISPSTIRH